jgi:hypothetical protein
VTRVKDQTFFGGAEVADSSEQVNDCEYCHGRIETPVEFDNGVEHLDFCSNECMEDWQERDFDRRAERAHERSMQ